MQKKTYDIINVGSFGSSEEGYVLNDDIKHNPLPDEEDCFKRIHYVDFYLKLLI